MAVTQQEQSLKNFQKPVVVHKPVDLSKVNFHGSSIFDQALLARIEAIEKAIAKYPVNQPASDNTGGSAE